MQATKASEGKLARTSTTTEQESLTTLYFGNLHPAVTVTILQEICSGYGTVEQVKVIKDKATGASAGYGFVKFVDRRFADVALHNLQAKLLYNQEIRVNWAFQSHQREDTSAHHHIFVGDIGQEVTDAVLLNAFSSNFGSCSDARVMWDHNTGRSKGYGFVSFRTKEEADSAIQKMQGQFIGSRRVRCGWAQHKQDDTQPAPDFDNTDRADPLNTNVYVGNIAPDWTEQDVQKQFSGFGAVVEVKLHKKGGYGFVRFEKHEYAVRAIVAIHGQEVGGRVLKCAWGKNAGGSSSSGNSSSMGGMGGGGAPPAGMQQFMQHAHHPMPMMMNPMHHLNSMIAQHQQAMLPHGGMVMQSPLSVAPSPQMVLMGAQGPTHPMTPQLTRQHSLPMDPHMQHYYNSMFYAQQL